MSWYIENVQLEPDEYADILEEPETAIAGWRFIGVECLLPWDQMIEHAAMQLPIPFVTGSTMGEAYRQVWAE